MMALLLLIDAAEKLLLLNLLLLQLLLHARRACFCFVPEVYVLHIIYLDADPAAASSCCHCYL